MANGLMAGWLLSIGWLLFLLVCGAALLHYSNSPASIFSLSIYKYKLVSALPWSVGWLCCMVVVRLLDRREL